MLRVYIVVPSLGLTSIALRIPRGFPRTELQSRLVRVPSEVQKPRVTVLLSLGGSFGVSRF